MMKSSVLLLAHPAMEEVAKGVINRCQAREPWTPLLASPGQANPLDTQIQEAQAQAQDDKTPAQGVMVQDRHGRKTHLEYQPSIQWGSFNDGFPNIFIDNVKDIAGRDVIFLGSFHTKEVIFEQLSVIYSIPRYLARSFTFILPYFPTGTMERVDKEGQVATAKTLATILSNIAMTARGPAQIIIFDIHALQERFYFSDTVIPRLESAIPLLLHELGNKANVAIAFPDDGAYKRFHQFFSNRPTIICNKIRMGNERLVKVKDGDPKGKDIVIVDDLIQSGQTLIECAKALMMGGATHISAYVTHAVFPGESWKKFTQSKEDLGVTFEKFWVTDSLPHARDICTHNPFKLLSLAPVIADALLGYDLKQQ